MYFIVETVLLISAKLDIKSSMMEYINSPAAFNKQGAAMELFLIKSKCQEAIKGFNNKRAAKAFRNEMNAIAEGHYVATSIDHVKSKGGKVARKVTQP